MPTSNSSGTNHFLTLFEAVRWRAEHQSDRVALRYLAEGEQETHRLTYSELDRQARNLAAKLQIIMEKGDRAVLCFPPGPEFAVGILGCIYAGVVAVPIYPPRNNRSLNRILAVVDDSGAKVALTVASVKRKVESFDSLPAGLKALRWLAFEEIEKNLDDDWIEPTILPSDLAFFQYTSGSTGDPKGVMIAHANLIANIHMIAAAEDTTETSVCVSWLPMHHDMGLIGYLMLPLVCGCETVILSPLAFLEKPVRWLRAVTQYRGTHVSAPNFAYELCLKRIKPEEIQELDLSSLKTILSGAEPIRIETLRRFAETFAPAGLRKRAMVTSYGLAEATLYVSGRHFDDDIALYVDKAHLEQGKIDVASVDDETSKPICSCGVLAEGSIVRIVNPETSQPCAENEVGEIWIAGPHVALGYWNKPAANARDFQAMLVGKKEKYLRTGDYGFFHGGELFVTGRLKDLIIVFGRNHYPHDIELTVEKTSDLVRPDHVVAFALEGNGSEQVAVVAEIERTKRKGNFAETADALLSAVFELHELQIADLVFLSQGELPKTSSGKVQRKLTRRLLEEGKLEPLYRRKKGEIMHETRPAATPTTLTAQLDWLRDYARTRLDSRTMDERKTIPPHVVLDLGNQGLLGMLVPKRFGGLETSHRDFAKIIEELAAIDLSLGTFVGLNNTLGLQPLLHSPSETLRQRWLPSLASGRQLAAFAVTEREAGSNPMAMKATATRSKGGWALNGEKIWIGNAGAAGVIHVFVKEAAEDGTIVGITGFSLAQGIPGMTFGPEHLTMGVRSMARNPVRLENVFVDDFSLLSEPGKGMELASRAMNFARFGLAAASVGGIRRCLQWMLRYSERRTIGTGLLAENPVTVEKLENATRAASVLESLVDFVAQTLDAKKEVSQEYYAVCKILGPEWLWETADATMQLLGGRGYMETNFVPQFFRDARLLRIFEGPTETLQMHLGSLLAKNPSLVGSMQREIEEWKSTTDERGTVDGRLLFHSLVGRVGALALVEKIVKDEAAKEWLRHRLEAEKQRAEHSLAAWGQRASEDIRASARASAQLIGNVDQHPAGEDRQVDSYLAATHEPPKELAKPAARPKPKAVPPTVTASATSPAAPKVAKPEKPKPSSAPVIVPNEQLKKELLAWFSKAASIPLDTIDPSRPLSNYGLDSVMAFELGAIIEETYQVRVPQSLVWDYPTLDAVADFLAKKISEKTIGAA